MLVRQCVAGCIVRDEVRNLAATAGIIVATLDYVEETAHLCWIRWELLQLDWLHGFKVKRGNRFLIQVLEIKVHHVFNTV